MEWILYMSGFLFCCALLYLAGEVLIEHLMKFSRFLGLTEFVVAFFVMALAASLPNLFVGVGAAIQGIPELSLGDIFGNNITAMTLAVALAVLAAPGKSVDAQGQTIQSTIFVTILAALLPLLLLANGNLSRADGLILISVFFLYSIWLFSKKNRFRKVYESSQVKQRLGFVKNFILGLRSLFFISSGILLLLVASQGIVMTASFFAQQLNISLVAVGLLVVGFGNALPEVYFSVASARRGETSMILGNLMGAVIFPSTLVLGIVSLIHPIVIAEFGFFVVSRLFVVMASVMFLLAAKSQQKIVKWEGILLLVIYMGFIAAVVIMS